MVYEEYQPLTPTDEIENGQGYIKALDWAFKNPKIRNIALAGPYGAGKSSIIDAYLAYDEKRNKWPKKKLSKTSLKISMATFVEEGSPAGEKIDINANEVEYGILKQLFYKVEHKKIPKSRYRKLYVSRRKCIFFQSLAMIAVLAFVISIFQPEISLLIWGKITNYVELWGDLPVFSEVQSQLGSTALSIFVLVLLFGIVVLTTYYLRCIFLHKYHFKGITFPAAEAKIEVTGDFSDSVFNKNLDEIMYFFEATKYRTIFFEDLDRLNDRKIFVHLRELNNLLNNDDSIKEKPVVFVYAVKDDIFTKEDRTKFFDFIIPVVPVVNATNSGDILLEWLENSKKNGNSHNISQEFILDVCPFISDMRVLKNICNEFILYKNMLCTSQSLLLSDEKMMAIIIFKNLYPRDFSELQSEKGIVKKAFEIKQNFILEEKERLQNEIDSFSDIIQKASSDHLHDVKEIKAAMLMELVSDNGFPYYLSVNGESDIYVNELMNDSFDLSCLSQKRIYSITYTRGGGIYSRNINDFTEKVAPYLDRIENLKKLREDNGKALLNQLESLKKRQHDLSGKSCVDIMLEYKNFQLDTEIVKNKLLIFLLRRGYIDEKYATYINYFKGASITTSDMNFILSIKTQEPNGFDYKLVKTPMVVKRLQEYEFELKAIYNFDLLNELLSNDADRKKREIFINQLADESELSWKFIDEFIDKTDYKEKFVALLCSAWSGIWKFISENPTIEHERKLYYLSLFLNIVDNTTLALLNNNDLIKGYIENHADILKELSNTVSVEKMCSVISQLNISFSDLRTNDVPINLLDYIFENRYYELSEKMIRNIVMCKNNTLVDRLTTQPYTVIIDLNYEPLLDYVKSDFMTYVKNNVIDKVSLKDRSEVILDMLSRVSSTPELCSLVLGAEVFLLHDIQQFPIETISIDRNTARLVWSQLLTLNKISSTWNNVVVYWLNFSFTDSLKEYMILHCEELRSSHIDIKTFPDKFIFEFVMQKMEKHIYERLLPILRMKKFNLQLEDIRDDVLDLMVKIKYFEFSVERYEYLRVNHYELSIEYIIKSQRDFIRHIGQIEMSGTLLRDLLQSKGISSDTKTNLLNLFAEKYMDESLVELIVDDFNHQFSLSKACFKTAWTYADQRQREKLFYNNFERLDADDLENCFADLGDVYTGFANRSSRHEVELDSTKENLRLAEHLRNIGYITSYEVVMMLNRKKEQKRAKIKYRIKQQI